MPHKLPPAAIDADRITLKAIEGLTGYQSVNPAYSVAVLQQINATLTTAQDATERTRLAYEQARAFEEETARTFHMSIRMAKSQVLVQFGDTRLLFSRSGGSGGRRGSGRRGRRVRPETRRQEAGGRRQEAGGRRRERLPRR